MKYLVLGVVVATLALAGGWLSVKASHAKRFSEVAWKSSETNKFGTKTGNVRKRMLNDLTTRVLKEGMPKEKVLSLLGPPDYEAQDANSSVQQYYLGQDSVTLALFPQLYYLDLCFGTNGNLKTHRIEVVN
jgi:hypothetical protein